MTQQTVIAVITALAGGGIAGSFIAFKKLPADIESISVTAAQGAVRAQAVVIERQGGLIEDLTAEVSRLRGELDTMLQNLEAALKKVTDLEQTLRRHGINGGGTK